MPRTAEDVETYLIKLERRFETDSGTFIIQNAQGDPLIALRVDPPVVAIRAAIGHVPPDEAHQAKLFRRLLEYNATDLMHASYGVEEGEVVLGAALELENLDLNELEAALSDIDLALARHVPALYDAAKK